MPIALNLARAALAACATAPLLAAGAPASSDAASDAVLDEVVVSGSRLREQAQIDVPASITALTSRTLTDSAQQHFQELLSQVPNLNWAAGSSRPRYFQIRGIGEREQYQGAPNSSVGFLIDDIDFSGVGMAATLFDVQQIEVLRGPQGTRLGANALAGLIAVSTAAPEDRYNTNVVAEIGSYDTRSLGIAATGPIEALDSSWRLAVQNYSSDGFRTNDFLNREDTNGRDETTARGKWRWRPSDRSQLDLTFMHADLANGYDAFSIDNSRVTLADEPGEDSQRANAAAAKWNNTFAGGSTFTLIATSLDSTSVHAYDADWGNPQSWAPYSDYSYVYRAARAHDTESIEARFASAPLGEARSIAWLIGAYGLNLNEEILETTNYSDPLTSQYQATNAAVFAEVDGRLARRWLLSAGLRGEQRRAEYEDTTPTNDERTDRMLGGQVSLTYELDRSRFYGAIARGYKAGGFNLGLAREIREEFEPEFLWNYELGFKHSGLNDRIYFDTSLFYMQREDMQVRSGEQSDPSNPATYMFVTSNVASGYNYGLESSVRWLPAASLELGASLGLLRTRESGSITEAGEVVAPRAQAHAPEYQVQVNATYRRSGWMARVDISAVDAFYFDVPADHDQRSQAYSLTNFKAGYESEHWGIHAWVHNVFDEEYATRGFFFANEPPDFEDKLYIQNGDPRQFGVSVQWELR